MKIGAWVLGIAIFLLICQLLGFDIKGWIESLWDQMSAIPPGYLIAALIFQSAQTVFAGVSYYGILGAAYPGEVSMRPIVTAYAVGVAGNSFLPANLGTLVTLLMFVAIIPSCSFSGSVAAYLVQKIFYTIIGTAVYLYLFLSVPGEFDISFGKEHTHPAFFFGVVAGGVFLIVVVVRIFWRQVKKLWAQAKQGGAILAKPKNYLKRVVWPEALSYARQDGRDRHLPGCVRDPGHLQLDHVGDRLGIARERRIVHPGRDRRHTGNERPRAQDVLPGPQQHGGRVLDRPAARHVGLERRVRVDPGRVGLRLDGREAVGRRRVRRREGEGRRDEGRPEAQERREARAEGSR